MAACRSSRPLIPISTTERHIHEAAFTLHRRGNHNLRIPFMLAVAARGFRVTAAGTGDPAPFSRAGLDYRAFAFDRFVNPRSDLAAIKSLSRLLADVRPSLVQSFDTKPNLLVPLAARRNREPLVIRTINGLGWVYSSRSPLALALAPAYRMLHRLAARSSDLTVFQNSRRLRIFRAPWNAWRRDRQVDCRIGN